MRSTPPLVAAAALLLAAGLAGCLGTGGGGPAAPVHEEIGTQETIRGTALDFAVPQPVEGARYVWTFGDGESSLGTTARHAWNTPGVYTVAWQEMRGTDVVRSSYGLVRVHDTVELRGSASSSDPSEATFEVHENATAIEIRFRAPAGGGPATVLLVDPFGAPVATEALDLAEAADVTLKATDPVPGEWMVYVELPEGEVAWTAAGTVKYG